MEKLDLENKNGAPSVDELARRVGRAEARGDEKEAKALRKALDEAVARQDAHKAEQAVQRARESAEAELATLEAVQELTADYDDLAKRWRKTGERLKAAAREIKAAWAEHEELFRENQALERRRGVLFNRCRHRGYRDVEEQMPRTLNADTGLDVPSAYLYPARMLARKEERYRGVRPEPRVDMSNGPPRRGPPPDLTDHDRPASSHRAPGR